MDHATLTDNNGKKADFRNVILIMTTNAGAREMAAGDIGFALSPSLEQELFKTASRAPDPSGKGKNALERTFSPEFRNRLDGSIVFNQLGRQEILRVVDKFVQEVRVQLIEKQVELDLTDSAKQWFAVKGFDKLYGARPMSRLIQQKIREPLAEELLFGKLEHGAPPIVNEKDGEIILEIKSSDQATRKSSSRKQATPASPQASHQANRSTTSLAMTSPTISRTTRTSRDNGDNDGDAVIETTGRSSRRYCSSPELEKLP